MSEAVAARIEAPQRGGQSDQSMRQMGHFYQVMYHSSGGLRAPYVKSVADFLRYLFQDRKLQPSTIFGYRSAIADSLEICPSMLVRMKISFVSWIASTETDPKAGGEPPPGTSPWFLHQLTRFILNQLKASLKHLTFKAVFLLALGSGKRRSEIHAWQTAQHH